MKKLLLALGILTTATAQAVSLSGLELGYSLVYTTDGRNSFETTVKPVTVGPQIELEGVLDYATNIDIDDTGFTISLFGSDFTALNSPAGGLNGLKGFKLFDVNNVLNDFTLMSVVSNNNFFGVNTKVAADSAEVSWINIGFSFPSLRIDIETAATSTPPPVSAVPLPGAGALMLSGIGMLAGLRRRAKKPSAHTATHASA